MKWIFLSGMLVSSSAIADGQRFYTPEVRCLNDHTIPFIETSTPAKSVVDDAYAQCKSELNEWMNLQEPLPDEMKQRMRKELYDFYIRMIEKRRHYEAKKAAEAAR